MWMPPTFPHCCELPRRLTPSNAAILCHVIFQSGLKLCYTLWISFLLTHTHTIITPFAAMLHPVAYHCPSLRQWSQSWMHWTSLSRTSSLTLTIINTSQVRTWPFNGNDTATNLLPVCFPVDMDSIVLLPQQSNIFVLGQTHWTTVTSCNSNNTFVVLHQMWYPYIHTRSATHSNAFYTFAETEAPSSRTPTAIDVSLFFTLMLYVLPRTCS